MQSLISHKTFLMKNFFYALIPLGLLIIFALVICVISYPFLQLTGDILPLHKLISKGTQIFLVLSIFPIKHYLGLSWSDLGFAAKNTFFKQILLGLSLGLLTLMPILILLYSLGINVIDEAQEWTISRFFGKFVIAFLLALLISFLEEPLFRGLLITAFRKKMAIMATVLLSSGYYAVLHFIKNKTAVPYDEMEFTDSFILLAGAFKNLLNPDIISAFIALLMVGIFLSVIRLNFKNSVGLCIGYHTGWVWQIKVSKDWFNTDYQSEYLYLVSNYDGVIGSLVSVWMLLLILLYFAYRHFSQNKKMNKNTISS